MAQNHPKCFSSKVMVKDVFLQNGDQCNTFRYVSHSGRSWQDVFNLLRGLDPNYVVKLWWQPGIDPAVTEIWPKMWFYRSWPWTSRWSVKVNSILQNPSTLPMRIYVKWDLIDSFSGKVEQKLTKRSPGEERRMKDKGETIWQILTHCDANYVMKERPDINITRR